jgi:glyoxylase-like metal-dependent hydrolase (beta-lactamase superfamily II)
MVEAADFQSLTNSLWLWEAHDPAVKSDLSSSAALLADRLFLFDPIPLAATAREKLVSGRDVAGVFLTNSNHMRAAAEFSRRHKAPIFGAEPAIGGFNSVETVALNANTKIAPEISAIPIEGAALGEMAFHLADDDGTVVVGDALIHLDPYGFALLPPKYCSNQKEMRRSLRQLLDWTFQRLLFAHGPPLLSSARARLETLLR